MSFEFDTGQVCLNGHLITGDIADGTDTKHCSKCGESTVTACQHCGTPIRGDRTYSGSFSFIERMTVQAYCHECGKPFPWTERAIAAAKELADEVDDIDDDDRQRAKDSFIALVSDTPQTTVAVARIRKLLSKASPMLRDGLKDVLVSIATEAAKKGLGF